VAQWLKDLDDEAFAVREGASRELEKLGDLIEESLRKEHRTTKSLEVRLRVDHLLAKIDGPLIFSDRLGQLRTLEVLERIGTEETRKLLQELADGAPEAWLTREAKASLARLKK
jgi:hypothetical protein